MSWRGRITEWIAGLTLFAATLSAVLAVFGDDPSAPIWQMATSLVAGWLIIANVRIETMNEALARAERILFGYQAERGRLLNTIEAEREMMALARQGFTQYVSVVNGDARHESIRAARRFLTLSTTLRRSEQ